MKNKSVKVAKTLLNILMTLLMVVSFVSLGLSIYCNFSFDSDLAKYFYLFLGVFIIPYEFLSQGGISGFFQNQGNSSLCIGVSLAVLVFALIIFILSSSMYNFKNSSTKRMICGIVVCVLIFIIFALFVTGAVILTKDYGNIENNFDTIGPEFIKMAKTSLGVNLITLKETIVAYVGALVCGFSLIWFILGMVHKSSKIKIMPSIYFYTSAYEPKTDNKPVEQKVKQNNQTILPEKDPKAKELIKKIMQLEELKDSGKLSTVDYTRLRQKVIRRYKN